MKTTLFSTTVVFALTGLANAYPSILAHLEEQNKGKAAQGKRQTGALVTPPFDAASQYVDTTGDHAFNPPGSGDQRGPCPGLNAMANHGYLPHNGVATIDEFITSTGEVFGMGTDLATILAVYGAVFDGNLEEWSIGGPTANVPSINVLSTPQGISGSHNKYEGDASPTRGDLYLNGQDYELVLDNFNALYEAGAADDNYDLDLLTTRRVARFQQNIDENPYFFNAPFSGVVAQPAAWSFIYRFMANKSEEYPEGQLNGEVLKSFFAVTGDYGNFTYTPGYERIPDNWYTRNAADPYDVAYLSLDSNSALLSNLQFGSVGGNTGTVDSFTGVDPADLTGGVYNADTLTEGNNLMCYGLQVGQQELPDLLSSILSDVTSAANQLADAFDSAYATLGCPTLTAIDNSQFSDYPGYTQLNADGAY